MQKCDLIGGPTFHFFHIKRINVQDFGSSVKIFQIFDDRDVTKSSSSSSTNGRHLEKGIKPSSFVGLATKTSILLSYNARITKKNSLYFVSQDFTKIRKTLSSSCENVVSFSQNRGTTTANALIMRISWSEQEQVSPYYRMRYTIHIQSKALFL